MKGFIKCGSYSLSQVASRVEMSTAWLNKTMHRTGVVNKIGRPGERSNFNEEDVESLRRVKILRTLNCEHGDIKWLNETNKLYTLTPEIRRRAILLRDELNDMLGG